MISPIVLDLERALASDPVQRNSYDYDKVIDRVLLREGELYLTYRKKYWSNFGRLILCLAPLDPEHINDFQWKILPSEIINVGTKMYINMTTTRRHGHRIQLWNVRGGGHNRVKIDDEGRINPIDSDDFYLGLGSSNSIVQTSKNGAIKFVIE